MARAFEDDLRRKFLAAYDRGGKSLRIVALDFGVSYGWACKVVAQRRKTGQAERVRHRPGPRSRITPEIAEYVRLEVGRQADLTLAELQRLLLVEREIPFSIGALWKLLSVLDLRLKKSRSMPRSATGRSIGSGERSILRGSRPSTQRD